MADDVSQGVAWDLKDLYASGTDPRIDADLAEVDRRAEAFAKTYRGRVGSLSVTGMKGLLEEYEDLLDLALKAGSFAHLDWAADTGDAPRGALLQKVTERWSRFQQALTFLDLEWANAPEETAAPLIASPLLERWRHYLTITRRYRPHMLTEPEEKILIEKNVTGRSAWTRFFDETIAAHRFDWEGTRVPEQVILSKLHEPDREARRKAASSLTAGLRDMGRTTTYVFNTVLADKASDDTLRRYPAWISSRNMENQVDDATVEALVGAVTGRYDIVARYYGLKRRLLGLAELYDYDRYAPLPAAERKYDWEQAKETVLGAYGAFHPRMAEIASLFFDNGWIDSAVRPGKRGGAFCHGCVPSVHPYILMNFEGNARDVMTLAHELGHGVHQYLSRDRGVLSADTPLTIAETASVFGEALVFQEMMRREKDPKIRLAMLVREIEDAFATVFRQVAMNRFEDAAHTERRSGGELPTERLSEIWLSTQRAMFGGSVILTQDYGIWWSYIPHFLHTPGYVYAYSFGDLLVRALYGRYASGAGGFADAYLGVLAAGGSDWPHVLMARLGVDLKDPGFWANGLTLLDGMVKQAEELAG